MTRCCMQSMFPGRESSSVTTGRLAIDYAIQGKPGLPISIAASMVAICNGYSLVSCLTTNFLLLNFLSLTSFPCAWHNTKPLSMKKKETPHSPPKQNSSMPGHVKCDMNIKKMNIILQPCSVSIILLPAFFYLITVSARRLALSLSAVVSASVSP